VKEAVQVTILGQVFTLRSDASPKEVQQVAAFVNQAIAQVSSSGKSVDSLHVSLLALLNVAQAYLQLQAERDREAAEMARRVDRLLRRLDEAGGDNPEVGSNTSLFGDV